MGKQADLERTRSNLSRMTRALISGSPLSHLHALQLCSFGLTWCDLGRQLLMLLTRSTIEACSVFGMDNRE